MSTKIYNGVVCKSNSMEEILQKFIKIREEAVKKHNEQLTVDELVFFIEQNGLKDKHVYDIYNRLEENISNRCRNIFDINFNFSIVLFPYKKKIYGIYFTDNAKEDYELISDLFDDYHYQDQCDKPEHISEEEWEERYNVWDELLGYDRISSRGFLYTFCCSYDLDTMTIFEKIREAKEKINQNETRNRD